MCCLWLWCSVVVLEFCPDTLRAASLLLLRSLPRAEREVPVHQVQHGQALQAVLSRHPPAGASRQHAAAALLAQRWRCLAAAALQQRQQQRAEAAGRVGVHCKCMAACRYAALWLMWSCVVRQGGLQSSSRTYQGRPG
jgi:hypothetical protein